MERTMAIEYTRRHLNLTDMDFEYTGSYIEKLQTAAKSNITKSRSQAKRRMNPYLGAVLILTRIAYYALGCIEDLPPPWDVPPGAEIESKTMPKTSKSSRAKAEQKKQDKKRKREEEAKANRPTTRAQGRQSDKESSGGHVPDEPSGSDHEQPPTGGASHEQTPIIEVTSIYDEQFQKRMHELQIPMHYAPHLTDTERELIRDITISISQDFKLVIKLQEAADIWEADRRKKAEEAEAKEEAALKDKREKERKAREEEMKTKGKEKVIKGKTSAPTTQPIQIPRDTILSELKTALEKDDRAQEATASDEPLEGILESFVNFYRDLKQKSLSLAEENRRQAQQLEEYRDQAQAASTRSNELQQNLEAALADKKQYMDDLWTAINDNVVYASSMQAEVNTLQMQARHLQRRLESRANEVNVLQTALDFATTEADKARMELAQQKGQVTTLTTEKQAIEEDLKQRQSQVSDLQSRIERLMTDLDIAYTSLDAIRKELAEVEAAKAAAEAKAKEAQEETAKSEMLLEIAEQKYEASKRAYKIAMSKRTSAVGPATPSSSIISGPTSTEMAKVKQLLSNSREENADLLNQIRNQERELADARQELQFLQKENQKLTASRQGSVSTSAALSSAPGTSAMHEQMQFDVPSSYKDTTGDYPETPEQLDPEWDFSKEFFEDLTMSAKDMYLHEATIKKLARKLWPNLRRLDNLELSAPLIKAKLEMEWEQWELDNPEITRAGYNVSMDKLRTREMLEGQPDWRREWMRWHKTALEIYRNSPRELRIDPTFCPCERRYNWDEFRQIQARYPLAINYPKLLSPPHYSKLTE